MFTELPTVTSAEMTDIICAVQGYSSSSVLGTSVQETLAQVYDLFQSNIILSNAGNPNGSVAGSTYQLCWDTTNGILYVCTTTGTDSTAVWSKSITLTAGSGISISQSGSTISISTSGSGVTWTEVTGTTQAMAVNSGYISSNGSLVTLSLPTTSAIGDVIYLVGKGAGGWSISQGSLQLIHLGSSTTTIGAGGSLSSTNRYDSISLVCTIANTAWTALGAPQGIITVV